jgi:4'-phosphopantetheinyl transferase
MGSEQSEGATPAARVVLRVDSVSACEPQTDRQGWSHLERARLAEISDPVRKAQYRVGHWRIRGLASVVFGGLPGVWRYERPPGECARLVDDERGLSCFVSISHVDDYIACAVSDDVVGTDLEMIRDERELAALARRCLSPREAEVIAQLSGPVQALAFYRGWAIREALGKAAGTGLVPGTARRIRTVPAALPEATLSLWAAADRVLVLAHAAGAKVEAFHGMDHPVEHFRWFLSEPRQEADSEEF